ncbi:MAG: FtsW/RodA/SpoVE family cell cycle protein [Bacilli bacterium]|nr:FtsW/RodA/SpoVE family cell cycle protein [Bacilli bacterium]
MKQTWKHFFGFYLPLLIIMTISLFVMYHARIISPLYSKNFFKQSIFFAFGILLLCFKNKIKISLLFDYSIIWYFLNCLLLIAVLFIGDSTNGAKAWFKLGFFSFQPSELMKLSLCLYLSKISENIHFKNKKQELIYLMKILIITLIPSILVFLEPDTGAIIFYFLIAIVITFQTTISKWWIGILLLILTFFGLSFFIFYTYYQDILIKIIGTSFFYRVERLLNFQQGLQIENALTAIGSAPFYRFNLNHINIYIPEAPTDFAFSLTTNVFGIIGIIILLISYFTIDIFLLLKWKQKKKHQDQLFFSAFLFIFFFNQFYNIFMNIGLVPIMGIPLPFLSYGGSSIIVSFLFLTIILQTKNKKKHKKRNKLF